MSGFQDQARWLVCALALVGVCSCVGPGLEPPGPSGDDHANFDPQAQPETPRDGMAGTPGQTATPSETTGGDGQPTTPPSNDGLGQPATQDPGAEAPSGAQDAGAARVDAQIPLDGGADAGVGDAGQPGSAESAGSNGQ